MSEPICSCGHYQDEHDERGECHAIQGIVADSEGRWLEGVGKRVPCICFHYEPDEGGEDE